MLNNNLHRCNLTKGRPTKCGYSIDEIQDINKILFILLS